MRYYSNNGATPLNVKPISHIFVFMRKNFHPIFREDFGHKVYNIARDLKISLTDAAAARMERHYMLEMGRLMIAAHAKKKNIPLHEAKKSVRFKNLTKIEFDSGVSPAGMAQILKQRRLRPPRR